MASPTAPSMRFAYRELLTPSILALAAGASLALIAVVAALGPMNTLKTLTLIQRLAVFGAITAFEVPACFGCGFFTLYVMRNRKPIHVALGVLVMCSIVVAPSLGSAAFVLWLKCPDCVQPRFIEIYGFRLLTFGSVSGLVFYTVYLRMRAATQCNRAPNVSSPDGSRTGRRGSRAKSVENRYAFTGVAETNDRSEHSSSIPIADDVAGVRETPVEATGATLEQGETPELLLPDEIGRDIVYVHVSGHYVEVITTAGKALLLMRLSDVVKALAGQGMQTHRSYWVAYGHIIRLEKQDRQGLLHLDGGHQVPVSRSYRSEVGTYMRARELRSG